MTLPLAESQRALAHRAVVAPLVLVKLETFSNYAAQTVASTFWWSRGGPARYDYGNTGTLRQFDDVISAISPLSQVMPSIPSTAVFPNRQSVTLEVSNGPTGDGSTIFQELMTEFLPFARVEIATLLVNPSLYDVRSDLDPWDLSDLTGDEHVVRFRGELTVVGEVTDQVIPVQFESIEPELPIPRATEAFAADNRTVDPKDRNKRLPIPVGQAKDVPCINWEVGWVTTLAEVLGQATTGNTTFTDTSDFPQTGSFTIRVTTEEMTASVVDATTLNVTARGINGTTASAHVSGEIAIEVLTTNKIIFSGVAGCEALQALYVVNPINGEKTLVDSAHYGTPDFSDTITGLPNDVGSVTMTAAQVRALIAELVAATAGSVSQQPDFEDQGADTVHVPMSTMIKEDPLKFRSGPPFSLTKPTRSVATVNTSPNNAYNVISTDPNGQQGTVWWWPVGSTPSSARTVIRYRFVLKCNVDPNDNQGTLTLSGSWEALGGNIQENLKSWTASAGTIVGETVVSQWVTPTGGPWTIEDFEDDYAYVEIGHTGISLWITTTDPGGGGWGSVRIFADQSFLEVEVEPEALTRTKDVLINVTGPSLGFGLQFLADVDGPGDGLGNPHETATDLVEWFVEDFTSAGTMEAASLAEAATRLTLPGPADPIYAGTLNPCGKTFGEVLARLGHETFSNIVPRYTVTGTEFRMLTPAFATTSSGTYFPATNVEIEEWRDLRASRVAAAETANTVNFLYRLRNPEPNRDELRDTDFRLSRSLGPDADASDLYVNGTIPTDYATRYGDRVSEPVPFFLIDQDATAKKIASRHAWMAAGWYGLGRPLRIGIVVPWTIGYDVEVGDVFELAVPGQPLRGGAANEPAHYRVTQVVFNFEGAGVGLNLEEVNTLSGWLPATY